MNRGWLSAAVGTVLGGILAAPNAWPQAVLPGTVQPGQIERQFQQPPEPRAKPAEIKIPEAGQKPPSNAQALRFVLTRLTVEGVTVYPAENVRALYGAQLGKEVTLLDIYRIAETLTARYRNDGFILSQVIVPAQAVEGGVVRLQAIEGYVASVRVEGVNAELQERVDRYAEKIKANRPLTAKVLERYLLLMNDLPGASARATLVPARTESGASDLIVQVAQRKVTGGLTLDNRGSRALGPYRLSGDADFFSVPGTPARTGLKFVTTGNGELNFLAFAHDQLIGAEGGKLGFTATVVRSRPEEQAVIPLNLETSSDAASLSYSYPLVRSRAENLTVRGTFSAHNGKTEIFGVRDTEDRVRAVRVGLTYDLADALSGVNIADVELSQGLRAFGASSNDDPFLSRPNGKVDFTKLTLYAARLQSITSSWSALAAVNAQYAFTDLLVSELFSFGGEQFGRGYDPSELVGDHGAALKLELRYSGTLPSQESTGYTAYGFYDVGAVRQRTSGGPQVWESAASTGLGLRLSAGRHAAGYIELAKPLTKIVTQENDRKLRTYAGISIRF